MNTDLQPLAAEKTPRSPSRWGRALAIILLVAAVLGVGSSLVIARMGRPLEASAFVGVTSQVDAGEDASQLAVRAEKAEAALDKLRPRGAYIVVDTYRNRLRLYKDGLLLRSAICSTGTGTVLRDPRNGRKWVFDTPLGERDVKSHTRNPVWAKPDWAFIEDGFLPPKSVDERLDPNALGDYALYLGDGYIIHGTLFKTLLGRRVTHGCVRLGDEDLEFVYKHVPIGSHVYMY